MLYNDINDESNRRILNVWVTNKNFFVQIVEGYDVDVQSPSIERYTERQLTEYYRLARAHH
jgi:hypothetical protein